VHYPVASKGQRTHPVKSMQAYTLVVAPWSRIIDWGGGGLLRFGFLLEVQLQLPGTDTVSSLGEEP